MSSEMLVEIAERNRHVHKESFGQISQHRIIVVLGGLAGVLGFGAVRQPGAIAFMINRMIRQAEKVLSQSWHAT